MIYIEVIEMELLIKYKKTLIIFFLIIISINVTTLILSKVDSSNQVVETSDDQSVASQEIYVDVKGSVVNPGMYQFNIGDRVDMAIKKAGGFDGANQECINLSEVLSDQMVIVVPSSNEQCEQDGVNDDGVVNINEATVIELELIPSIGPTKAQSIYDYRESNGLYTSTDQLLEVDGIGPATLENIEPYISL